MSNPVDLPSSYPTHDFVPYSQGPTASCAHTLRDGTACNEPKRTHPRADLTEPRVTPHDYAPSVRCNNPRCASCDRRFGPVPKPEPFTCTQPGCSIPERHGHGGAGAALPLAGRPTKTTKTEIPEAVARAVKNDLQDAISEESECGRQAQLLEARALKYRQREERARLARVELREFADVNGIDLKGWFVMAEWQVPPPAPETEHCWGPGLFPNPGITYDPDGTVSGIPNARPAVPGHGTTMDDYRDLVASKRSMTTRDDETLEEMYTAEGNADRFGPGAPLVQQPLVIHPPEGEPQGPVGYVRRRRW